MLHHRKVKVLLSLTGDNHHRKVRVLCLSQMLSHHSGVKVTVLSVTGLSVHHIGVKVTDLSFTGLSVHHSGFSIFYFSQAMSLHHSKVKVICLTGHATPSQYGPSPLSFKVQVLCLTECYSKVKVLSFSQRMSLNKSFIEDVAPH